MITDDNYWNVKRVVVTTEFKEAGAYAEKEGRGGESEEKEEEEKKKKTRAR